MEWRTDNPPKGADVLITMNDIEEGARWVCRVSRWYLGELANYRSANDRLRPVAWMPTPEPYTGDKDVQH